MPSHDLYRTTAQVEKVIRIGRFQYDTVRIDSTKHLVYSGLSAPNKGGIVVTRTRSQQPTNVELELLRILWKRGPSTVREVHEALDRATPVGYTTVLKVLQIMTEKGLVTRDESARTHVYSAAVTQDATQKRLVTDLVDRAFGGSALGLVMQALSAKPASPEELQRIRALLDGIQEENR